MTSRAAIVIGVAATGEGLARLRGVAEGAERVAAWLEADGYQVVRLVDGEAGEVLVGQIKDAVRGFVDLGTVRQLVIYFAGHGYLNGSSEIWLLSRAPDDPDEAVDQTTSAEHARLCGIPSVTFVSDCCRSSPSTLRGSRVTGSSIFPNRTGGTIDVEVDRLFATRPGYVALEMSSDATSGSYDGLFTSVWREMHRDPPGDLRRVVTLDGVEATVVPNRALKRALPARVDALAQSRSVLLTQSPEFRLEGGDSAFVAKASFTAGVPADRPAWWSGQALGRVLAERSARSLAGIDDPVPPPRDEGDLAGFSRAVLAAMEEPRFSRAVDELVARQGDVDRSACIQVFGDGLVGAWAFDPALGRFREDGEAIVGGTRVVGVAPTAGSMLLALSSGIGTVVLTIPGSTTWIVVEGGLVVHVGQSEPEVPGSAGRRAIASVAARAGLLASDREEARSFGALASWEGGLDPSTCILAAMAYADLGMSADLSVLSGRMREGLGMVVFDVALLAGELRPTGLDASGAPVVPPCPALGSSWAYLRARGVKLPTWVARAARHRSPGPWTTFEEEGVALMARPFVEGRVR